MATEPTNDRDPEWELVNVSPTTMTSRTLPIFDKFLDIADYKEFIQYAYFCTWEPEGRDKCFLRIFQEYIGDPKDYIEADPSSLPDFGRRNVLIMIPNLLRTTAPVSNEVAGDTYEVDQDENGESYYWSLLYVLAYDPAVVQEEGYSVNERYQFEGLEDIIVGYSPHLGITEDFFLGFANDLKHCYDSSAEDCWRRESEVDGERREKVVTQVLAHLREKHGDIGNKEEFWRNWFSFAEGGARLERFLNARTFRTDPPWREQYPEEEGDETRSPPGDISIATADAIEAGLAHEVGLVRIVALTERECFQTTSREQRRRRRGAREAREREA